MAVLTVTLALMLQVSAEAPGSVYFQAHRGGVDEVPENTMPAYEHAWNIPGAVPEVDVQTTQDGAFVCMHDETPKRTTDALDPWDHKKINEIPLSEVQKWDAGVKFRKEFKGTRVPTLDEVFAAMKGRPDRQVYLDIKEVNTDLLVEKIKANSLERQVIFVHGEPEVCAKFKKLFEGARTMTWLSGTPEVIKKQFEALKRRNFQGISQLQFHLRSRTTRPEVVYAMDDAFLKEAADTLRAAGAELQLRPFVFTPASLRRLIDLGIHWYVTDAPQAFGKAVTEGLALPAKNN